MKKRTNSIYISIGGNPGIFNRTGAAYFLMVGRGLGYKWVYSVYNNLPMWTKKEGDI